MDVQSAADVVASVLVLLFLLRAGKVCQAHVFLVPVNEAVGINSAEATCSVSPIHGEVGGFEAVCRDERLFSKVNYDRFS